MNQRPLLAIIALTSVAPGASIRDVDFKNFTFPFAKSEFVSVPSRLRWLPLPGTDLITTRDGEHRFPCDTPPCELLTVDRVDFGDIKGITPTSAIVTTTFHTGGTAHWQYLYVVAFNSSKPKVVGWLESGLRADIGLRSASADRGDLVLVVNDPDKRQGDCCSTGTITYRYRWLDGSFHRIGAPVRKDDPTR